MTIKEITIKNYRSILEVNLPIEAISERQAAIFLGVNESGKSNILKAVSLLDASVATNYNDDCNKDAKKVGEQIIVEYEMIFDAEFYRKESEKFINPKLSSKISINRIKKIVSINKDNLREDYYYIWIDDLNGVENFVFNEAEKNIKLIKDVYTGEEKLTKDNIATLLPGHEFTDKDKIEGVLEEGLVASLDRNTPEAIYWKGSDEYLINEPIDLRAFKEDNTISAPLRNIFKIAGIENIKERINLIEGDEDERFSLSKVLSEKITKYINKIWPEHKIEIEIVIEESFHCKVKVKDKDRNKDTFKMNQRSEGFKQFVSILLNLSAENDAKDLKDKIIILDEPETHLHPSGVKYLRNELLKIAKTNVVLIASHSIFMVDKLNLDRHYSVVKKGGQTHIEKIKKDNPYQEDVIYEAMGTSIYELVKPNMIVMEGPTDKDVFDIFTKKFKREFKPLDIGAISAGGVEKVPIFTKFFDGRFVRGFVLVDSDNEGKRIKKQIIKNGKHFNEKNTFEINDILNTKMDATMEDLLPVDIILESFKKVYKLDLEIDRTQPVIVQIKKKLQEEKKIGRRDELTTLKVAIIKKIMNDKKKIKADFKEKYKMYYKFVETLHNKMKK
jgi:predicted ATPase